jgi:hypothetical protein
LIDACFCGTLVSQSRSSVLSEKYPSSRVFASGRKELVDDGTPWDNSPFAKAIINTLKRNVDRVMRATDLISSVTKQVEFDVGQEPVEGRIKDAHDEGGEFVFHLKITEDEIWQSVVSSDTSEDYAKYVDYFPDGDHAHDARDRIRQLTDDEDWLRSRNMNSKSSLTEYLESHPNGAHYDEVRKMLEQLEEESSWQHAKAKGAITGYLDYLRGYPDGKFVREAKRQIELQKAEMQSDKQEQLEVELRDTHDAGKAGEEDKNQYKSIIKEAEVLFAGGNYADSIVKYEFALGLYQPSFVPESSFVQQRLKRAKRGVEYDKYLREGKTAVTEGQYVLALENLQKAQKIEDTVKIRDWISHVSNKITRDQPRKENSELRDKARSNRTESELPERTKPKNEHTDPDHRQPPKKKKGFRVVLMIAFVAITLLSVVWLVWNLNTDNVQYKDSIGVIEQVPNRSMEDIDDVSRDRKTKNQEVLKEVPRQNSKFYNNEAGSESRKLVEPIPLAKEPSDPVLGVLFGSWYVYERVVYNQSMRESGNLIEAYYTFYRNGKVEYEIGSYPYNQFVQGSWSLANNQLAVSFPGLGDWAGNITSYSTNEITWETAEPGLTSLVFNTLVRD